MAGAALVTPPLLISTLLLRSFTQQILSQRDYLKFKNMVNKMLDAGDLKETLRAVFREGEGPATSSSRIDLQTWIKILHLSMILVENLVKNLTNL